MKPPNIPQLRFQFEKAAIESKKQITKLEEENSASQTELTETKALLDKKEEEFRTINKKIQVRLVFDQS